MTVSTLYPDRASAQTVLSLIETFEEYLKRHPQRAERNGQGVEVWYRRYGDYWFAVGASKEAAMWSARQGWSWPFDRLQGVVWC